MLRVVALVTFVGVVFVGTTWLGSHGVSQAGDEFGSGVRMPLRDSPPDAVYQASERSVIVEPGDHLWRISERHVTDSAPGREVAAYWRRVVVTNTPLIDSGDPDLIYPGEHILLPELTERP